jgi:hypothetical protein
MEQERALPTSQKEILPVINQINPVHNLTPHPIKIHLCTIHLYLCLLSDIFPSGLSTKMFCSFLIYPTWATS